MAWAPRFSLLLKVLFRVRDRAAAEGLFLEGSVEFDGGDASIARLMFFYGTKLDPDFAGNFYNLAAATEKIDGPTRRTLDAWRAYLGAAERDPRQSPETRSKVAAHVAELAAKLDKSA